MWRDIIDYKVTFIELSCELTLTNHCKVGYVVCFVIITCILCFKRDQNAEVMNY